MRMDYVVLFEGNSDLFQILSFTREPNVGEQVIVPGCPRYYELASVAHKTSDSDDIPPRVHLTLIERDKGSRIAKETKERLGE